MVVPHGGYGVTVNTGACGALNSGSIPDSHPIFGIRAPRGIVGFLSLLYLLNMRKTTIASIILVILAVALSVADQILSDIHLVFRFIGIPLIILAVIIWFIGWIRARNKTV